MRTTAFPIAAVLAAALAVPAHAGMLAGVTMPDTVQAGDGELVLNGMALRSKLMFKVYVAGLYLPARQSDAAAVLTADQPRRTVMQFLRKVSSQQMCDAWREGLEANSPQAATEVRAGFDTLCSWMGDVGESDRMVFTYLPGEGTRVEVKGEDKGVLPGKPFADALWACWIGPRPGPGEAFKRALLGG